MSLNSYGFTIYGKFDNIDTKLVPITDHDGITTGFLLPDGRSVNLVMALEVISPEGDKIDYVTKESEMTSLGFELLDYDLLTFTKYK